MSLLVPSSSSSSSSPPSILALREEMSLPMSQMVELNQHKKIVSGLDTDRSGSRLLSCSHDQTLALYDFPGMDDTLAPFRFVRPLRTIPVRGVRFSRNGEHVLVLGGGAPLLLDRHGAFHFEYARGDQYLRDMRVTGGHVGSVLGGDWHPTKRGSFITTGQDGTIRWWGTEEKKCEAVLVVRAHKPGSHPILSQVLFTSPTGDELLVGGNDGFLRVYSSRAPWVRPVAEVADAHQNGCLITGLAFHPEDNHKLASRAMDGTLKLWDVRKLVNPVAIQSDLPNDYEETSVIFSPDGQSILTGTSVPPRTDRMGNLHVFNSMNLNPQASIPIASTSIVALHWSKPLNQIFLGLGNGIVRAYYDSQTSHNGIMIGVGRPATATSTSNSKEYVGTTTDGIIINPHALPLFRTPIDKLAASKSGAKRIKLKSRLDPNLSHRPELPVEGPGSGGRIGSSVTQSIMKNIIRDTTRDEDPREALLRYAEVAEREPLFVSPAYQETQPTPILDANLLRMEAEDEEKRQQADAAIEKLARKLGPVKK